MNPSGHNKIEILYIIAIKIQYLFSEKEGRAYPNLKYRPQNRAWEKWLIRVSGF